MIWVKRRTIVGDDVDLGQCLSALDADAVSGNRGGAGVFRIPCVLAAALLAADALAAPLPQFVPVDLCGDIVSHSWQPERFVPAKPGFSGSLGRDRTFPARFRIVLRNYRGIDAATARTINGYLGLRPAEAGESPAGPARVVVLLPHADSRYLDGAVSLCVEGFHISGDEGGTWTRYRSLSVSRAPRR
jgi:hypothetical protein